MIRTPEVVFKFVRFVENSLFSFFSSNDIVNENILRECMVTVHSWWRPSVDSPGSTTTKLSESRHGTRVPADRVRLTLLVPTKYSKLRYRSVSILNSSKADRICIEPEVEHALSKQICECLILQYLVNCHFYRIVYIKKIFI